MIPAYLEDDMLKACLHECGKVLEWIRPYDRLGKKLRSFGFCVFDDGVGALRCKNVLGNVSFRMSYLAVKVGSTQQAKLDEISEVEKNQFLNGTEGVVDPTEKDSDVKRRIEALLSGERSINDTYGIVEKKKEKKRRKIFKKKDKKSNPKAQKEREEGEESDDDQEEGSEEESEYEEYTDSDSDVDKKVPAADDGSAKPLNANAYAAEMFFAADEISKIPDEQSKELGDENISPEEREMLKNIADFRIVQAEREVLVANARKAAMKKRIHDEMIRIDYDQRRAIEMAPKIAEEEARRAKRAAERQQREEMERMKNAAPVKVEMKGMGLGSKKRNTQAMFKNDADDDKPMRTLIPIDFGDDNLPSKTPVVVAASAAPVLVASAAPTVKKTRLTDEEIASSIPKNQEELNQYKLDWKAIKSSRALENIVIDGIVLPPIADYITKQGNVDPTLQRVEHAIRNNY